MRIWISCLFCACLLVLSMCGCSSPKGDFVEKSEAELAAMELQNDNAHAKFVSGNYDEAMQILNNIGTERTVSRPLYQMEKLSVLLMDGKFDEAHEQMMALHSDFETLFDKKSEEKAPSGASVGRFVLSVFFLKKLPIIAKIPDYGL